MNFMVFLHGVVLVGCGWLYQILYFVIEIHALKGSTISIANKKYIIVEATTEPKLNDDCDMIGTYVFLNVEKII